MCKSIQARREVLLPGLEIGAWVAMGYLAQGIGLETASAGKAAFICSLVVVVCPLLAALDARLAEATGRPAPPGGGNGGAAMWASVGLAVRRVACLELGGATAPVPGDAWLLLQPLGYGLGFYRTEAAIRAHPDQAGPITALQVRASRLPPSSCSNV